MNRLAPTSFCRAAIIPLLGNMVLPALIGCDISKPALPSYTLRMSIPLGEERIDILDAIEDEDYLIALEDGTLGFWVSGDPETVSLDFDLGVDVPRREIRGELGAFSLDIDANTDFTFSFVQLYEEAAYLDGLPVVVPDFIFDVRSNSGNVANLESATLTAGSLTVTIENGLPVPISDDSAQYQIVLDLLDVDTGLPLQGNEGDLRLYFDRIDAGYTSQESIDLAGVNLPGQIAVRLIGGSPGSGGDTVTVNSQASITVEAAFVDIIVEDAVAVVPAQSFTMSFTTPLPADYGVMEAVIDAGSLTVTVANEMPIPCRVVVTWPQVFDPDGAPLELALDLSAQQVKSSDIDFSGCVARAQQDSEALSELTATISVTSPGSGSESVALQADQGMEAITSSGRIEFVSITGTVPELSYHMQPTEQEIDLPDELDGLLLSRAELVLELVSRTSVPALVRFDLIGINKDGVPFPMPVEQRIEAAPEGGTETTRIILNNDTSDIVDFLNHMPTTISLAGNVQIGWEAGMTGTVQREDYAVINWEIIAPVEVRIVRSQLYGTVKELDLGDDARNRIQDHFGAAKVELEILNHLPVGIEARLLLGPDPELIKQDPLLIIGPVTIEAGNVASNGHGNVFEPLLSQSVVSLTNAQTKLLATPDMLSLIEVHLHDTGDEPVRVMVTDYIAIQGMIRLDIDVHDNP